MYINLGYRACFSWWAEGDAVSNSNLRKRASKLPTWHTRWDSFSHILPLVPQRWSKWTTSWAKERSRLSTLGRSWRSRESWGCPRCKISWANPSGWHHFQLRRRIWSFLQSSPDVSPKIWRLVGCFKFRLLKINLKPRSIAFQRCISYGGVNLV